MTPDSLATLLAIVERLHAAEALARGVRRLLGQQMPHLKISQAPFPQMLLAFAGPSAQHVQISASFSRSYFSSAAAVTADTILIHSVPFSCRKLPFLGDQPSTGHGKISQLEGPATIPCGVQETNQITIIQTPFF